MGNLLWSLGGAAFEPLMGAFGGANWREEIKLPGSDRTINSAMIMPAVREITIAVLLPPLAVYRRTSEFGPLFWACLMFTIAGYLPGVVWALIDLFEEGIQDR